MPPVLGSYIYSVIFKLKQPFPAGPPAILKALFCLLYYSALALSFYTWWILSLHAPPGPAPPVWAGPSLSASCDPLWMPPCLCHSPEDLHLAPTSLWQKNLIFFPLDHEEFFPSLSLQIFHYKSENSFSWLITKSRPVEYIQQLDVQKKAQRRKSRFQLREERRKKIHLYIWSSH